MTTHSLRTLNPVPYFASSLVQSSTCKQKDYLVVRSNLKLFLSSLRTTFWIRVISQGRTRRRGKFSHAYVLHTGHQRPVGYGPITELVQSTEVPVQFI